MHWTGKVTSEAFSLGSLHVAWYGIIITCAMILALFISIRRVKRINESSDDMLMLFLICIPIAVIAARLGYVVSNYKDYFVSPYNWDAFVNTIAIWNGGLTILWGVPGGVVGGLIWAKIYKKDLIRVADIVLPTVLLAQAIGRWGNFFNQEVYGAVADPTNYWWLPKAVQLNMFIDGEFRVPLFFIEGCMNLVGYLLIRFAVGKGLRKYIELGDLCFSYIVWYGLTRVALEPLRHEHYNMGQDGYWSWFWSIIFVLVGTLLIFVNHLVRYLIDKKKGNVTFKKVSMAWVNGVFSFFGVLSIGLIIIGAIFMAKNTRSNMIAFDPYNVSLIMLVIGLSLLFIFGCVVIYLLRAKAKEKHD